MTIQEREQAILDKIMEIKEESIELKSALEDADSALDVLGGSK